MTFKTRVVFVTGDIAENTKVTKINRDQEGMIMLEWGTGDSTSSRVYYPREHILSFKWERE